MSTDWNPERTARMMKRRLERWTQFLQNGDLMIRITEEQLAEDPSLAENPDGIRNDLSIYNGMYVLQSVGIRIPTDYAKKMKRKGPNEPDS